MYFWEELTKAHQDELLHEADVERELKRITNDESNIQMRLFDSLGDFLITSGQKLKKQHQVRGKQVHSSQTLR